MTDIRTATVAEADDVIATLTLAFATDPVLGYWFPRAADYLAWFPQLAVALGGRAFEHGTATIAGDVEACALWLSPGVKADPARMAALDMPGDAESAAISAEFGAAMDSFRPVEPHWYLWMIGVDPRRQGRGLGSALLKHTLARCDAEGAVAYLESSTPKNIPLYERHGFEVIGEIRVRDVPVITPMIRRPR